MTPDHKKGDNLLEVRFSSVLERYPVVKQLMDKDNELWIEHEGEYLLPRVKIGLVIEHDDGRRMLPYQRAALTNSLAYKWNKVRGRKVAGIMLLGDRNIYLSTEETQEFILFINDRYNIKPKAGRPTTVRIREGEKLELPEEIETIEETIEVSKKEAQLNSFWGSVIGSELKARIDDEEYIERINKAVHPTAAMEYFYRNYHWKENRGLGFIELKAMFVKSSGEKRSLTNEEFIEFFNEHVVDWWKNVYDDQPALRKIGKNSKLIIASQSQLAHFAWLVQTCLNEPQLNPGVRFKKHRVAKWDRKQPSSKK